MVRVVRLDILRPYPDAQLFDLIRPTWNPAGHTVMKGNRTAFPNWVRTITLAVTRTLSDLLMSCIYLCYMFYVDGKKVHKPSSLLNATKCLDFEKLETKLKTKSKTEMIEFFPLPSVLVLRHRRCEWNGSCQAWWGWLCWNQRAVSVLADSHAWPIKRLKFDDLIDVILQDVPRQTGFPEEAAAAFARR